MKTAADYFDILLNDLTDDLRVNAPCQVVGVDGNYVDVTIFRNDPNPDMVLYHVPIQRPETQRAYIFLGIAVGDRGTLKFFDRSTEAYLQSDFNYNSDDRQHNINDRAFQLGFIPDAEAFVYPTNAEIEIGLKSQTAKITFNEGTISIVGDVNIIGNLTVSGSVTATGEVTGNGIPLSTHIHGNGNEGADTTVPKA